MTYTTEASLDHKSGSRDDPRTWHYWLIPWQVSGEGLVLVFGDHMAKRVGLDRLTAPAQLLGDRATLVLRALGRVEHAWDRGDGIQALGLSV